MRIKRFILIVWCLFAVASLFASPELIYLKTYPPVDDSLSNNDTIVEKECEQKGIVDLFRKKNKPPKPPKRTCILILPTIAANPANGLMLGLGGNAGWFLGDPADTRVSFGGISAVVTTKEQLMTSMKTNIYTRKNKVFLQGDWRYYIYSNPTYGLGTNAPDTIDVPTVWAWQGAETSDTDGGYPMEYRFLKIHQTGSYRFARNLYAGLGYHLDYYYDIRDLLLDLDTLPLQLTPHYAYSRINGFDTGSYMLSGLSLNLIYDSRDNLINSYKGYFVNINYRYNPTFLGSDRNSSQLWLEFRTFQSLSESKPRHLIGFWFFGNFLISGEQPYLTLMATAEDQKARSGRGYIQGRYRGEDFLYGEIEYRFPIIPCSHLLGGVLFVNATTASNRLRDVHLFEYVRPSVGFGLRFMFNKFVRTNINIDFGFGYKSRGLYFSGTETF